MDYKIYKSIRKNPPPPPKVFPDRKKQADKTAGRKKVEKDIDK